MIATFYIEEDEEYLEDLKARVKKAESEFSTEVKSKKVAIAELEHNLSILPEGSDKEIMKARLEKAKMDYTEYLKTEASIKEMKTTLSDYQKEIKRTKVYAEHAGEVVERCELDSGNIVAQGNTLAVVAKKADFLIEVEDEASAFRYNMEVDVKLGSNLNSIETTMKGRVVGATNYLDVSERKNKAYVKIEQPPQDANWKRNIYIEYTAMEVKDALLIPKNALQKEVNAGTFSGNTNQFDDFGWNFNEEKDTPQESKSYVMKLEDGVLKKRYVITAAENSEYYLALEGVNEGDVLILDK